MTDHGPKYPRLAKAPRRRARIIIKPGMPKMPRLSAEGRAEWKRSGPSLVAMGILTKADGDIFGRYCEAWATWLRLARTLDREGDFVTGKNGRPKVHPLLRVQDKLASELTRLSDRLGTNPRARVTIHRARFA